MDLGISTFTDDQLVELLQEACNELAQRDPIVRKAAQQQIDQEALKLKMLREESYQLRLSREQMEENLRFCIVDAIRRAKKDYMEQLQREVYAKLQEELKAGTYRPLNGTEEAQAVVDAVKEFEHQQKQAQEFRRRRSVNPYPPQQGVPPTDKETPYSADRTVVDRFDRKF